MALNNVARRLAVAALVAGLGLTAAACGGAEEGDGEASTLTVDTSFVLKGLDPARVYEATGITAVHALYDTLMTFKGSDVTAPVPALAESVSASEDARTFTFTLRGDATFSDGTPVTSADVLFSLTRLQNVKGSPSTTVAGMTFAAPDAKTIVVTTAEPNPSVPTILAMPSTGVLNAKAAKEHGASDAADAAATDTAESYLNTTAVGSGPYVIESFDASSQIVLKANEKYWGTKPEFGRVVIRNMDVQNQKLTMAKATSAEIALDLSGEALTGLPDTLQQSGSQDTIYLLRMSVDPAVSSVSANPEFVKALRAAIDYKAIAGLFGTSAQPAAGLIPTAFAGSLPQAEAQQQDLEAARAALTAGGLGEPAISLLYPSITYRGVDLGTVAAAVQSEAAKAGITIELNPAPIASFLDQRRGGKVALSLSPQSLNYPVAASSIGDYMPGGGAAKLIGWTTENADPATVAAATTALSTTDATAQAAAVQEWQRLMNAHSPYIPLAYNSGVVVATPDLKGAQYSPAGWQVSLAEVTAG